MKRSKWMLWLFLLIAVLTACAGKPQEEPSTPAPAEAGQPKEQSPEEKPAPEEKPDSEDILLHAVDVELGKGVSGRLELYGKALNEYDWGVRGGTWTPEGEDEPSCGFTAREAIEAENEAWGLETGESDWDYYTQAWERDGGLVLADFNFDGYLDIALQAATPAYNWPHYYWLYNPDTGNFDYSFHQAGLSEVLPDQQVLVYDYRSTPYYSTSYWGIDENGELSLAHRNTVSYGEILTSTNEYCGIAVTQLTEAEVAEFADYFNRPERLGLLRNEYMPSNIDIPSYDFTDGCRFRDGSVLLYYHITGELHFDLNFPMHALLKPDGDGGWEVLRSHPDGNF